MRRAGWWIAGLALAEALMLTGTSRGEWPHLQKHNWFAGTYLDPAIQRPDILPNPLATSIPEYRQVYNRPRYLTGKFLYHIEPSSQEAMAWETNVRNGNYRYHRGAYIPGYYYPKPWEALSTQARPDFQRPTGLLPVPSSEGPVMEAVNPRLP